MRSRALNFIRTNRNSNVPDGLNFNIQDHGLFLNPHIFIENRLWFIQPIWTPHLSIFGKNTIAGAGFLNIGTYGQAFVVYGHVISILTDIEYTVLKSIYEYSVARKIDPILAPIRIDRLQSRLDARQVEITINAMVVFNYVTILGTRVALTDNGFEAFKNARPFGRNAGHVM